jgi:outer membrane protein TolC
MAWGMLNGLVRRGGGGLAIGTGLILGGCASFSSDGGMTLVADQTGSILGQAAVKIRTEADVAAVQARVRELLSKPLTVEAAVEIALLNNRALQAAYNDLGVSEAEMIQASLPPAPTLSYSYLSGSGFEIERQLVQNVLALLTLPRRREIAEEKFAAAQLRGVEVTLSTVAETRRAYINAVASVQIAKFLEEARASAETVSDVAKKLGETGAMSKLDQAREHAFYAEVSGDLSVARLKRRTDREKLNRMLGLWGADLDYRLPDKLKGLPGQPKAIGDIETIAVMSRVDLEIARMELALLAKQYGLTRTTRFIDVLEVSGRTTRERTPITDAGETDVEKTDRDGVEVSFEIPIYDFGEARTRLAEESYLGAVNRLVDKAVNVRADAREAYQAYRGDYDIARHYDREILPLRDIISEQTLLNYNGMLSDLFALLTDARARIAANVKAIEAKRDFWLASADLGTAINGGGRGGSIETAQPTPVADSGGER